MLAQDLAPVGSDHVEVIDVLAAARDLRRDDVAHAFHQFIIAPRDALAPLCPPVDRLELDIENSRLQSIKP